MRSAFTIAFLHFALLSFGQIKLEGIYDQEYGFRIIFKNDSLFEYSDGEAREILGRGVFKIESNMLILRFINHDTLNGSIVMKESNCDNDSVSFTFHISDRITGEAVAFTMIYLTDSLKLDQWKLSDINGDAVFKFKIQAETMIQPKYFVDCRAIAYEFFKTTISNHNCKYISIGLIAQKCTIENGTMWKYKILKISNDKLFLKDLRPFSISKSSSIFLHKIKW
jgi:hypothetical protein